MNRAAVPQRRWLRYILPACLTLLLPSCNSRTAADEGGSAPDGAPAGAGAVADTLPEREEFVLRGLRTTADTRASLAEALGAPDSIEAEAVPNRHNPGITDTLLTVHYPELVAHIHRPGGGGELLSSVQVSSNRHLRYDVIGRSRATIEEAFGVPDERSDSTVTYYCRSCEASENPVELSFRNGRVQRIRFNYYVD